MDAVQHLTKNIELLLACRTITNPHRARIAIAAEMCQCLLSQVTFTSYTIHDLQVFTVYVRETA